MSEGGSGMSGGGSQGKRGVRSEWMGLGVSVVV